MLILLTGFESGVNGQQMMMLLGLYTVIESLNTM